MSQLYIPNEVLTFNKLNKLIVLPFEKMKRLKVPFRFKGKWFRRMSKKGGQCAVIKIIIENNNLIMLDYHDDKATNYYWKYRETVLGDELIAVFDNFLTDWEQKSAISTLNFYAESKSKKRKKNS